MQNDGYLQSQKRIEKGKMRIYYKATAKGKQAFSSVKPKISELVSEVVEEY
jgi:DNA-binding PadR family transcriptional regulator